MGETFLLLFALFAPLLAAWLWLPRFPGVTPWADRLWRAGLAVALGMGAASLALYAVRVLAIRGKAAILADLLLFAALIALGARRRQRERVAAGTTPGGAPGFSRSMAGVFLVALILAAVGLIALSLREPHGRWDGWAIWNLHARFLADDGAWTDLFSNPLAWSHPDYPLLLPGVLARAWLWAGATPTIAPAMVAILFTLALPLLAAGALWQLHRPRAGWAAALLILGTPQLLRLGASQYADVPLALYVLATVALLAMAEGGAGAPDRLHLLAGLTASLAAWNKNEGLVFCGMVLLAAGADLWRHNGRREALRRWIHLLAGMAPVLTAVLHFKLTYAPPNDLAAVVTPTEILYKLLDPARVAHVAGRFALEIAGLGYGLAILFALWCALARRAFPPETPAGFLGGRILLLMLAAYGGIFWITPQPLGWHLDTAAARLLLQLWPVAVVVGLMRIGTGATARCSPKWV